MQAVRRADCDDVDLTSHLFQHLSEVIVRSRAKFIRDLIRGSCVHVANGGELPEFDDVTGMTAADTAAADDCE